MGATVDLAKDVPGQDQTTPAPGSRIPLLPLRNLLVFEVAFYLAYRYGMSFPQEYPAPFWFPDSVLLCALLLTPRKTWWMYIVAPLPIRLLLDVPVGMPAWYLPACFVNDSLKGLLAAWLLTRAPRPHNWFETLQGLSKYLLVAVLLVPFLSAFAGAAKHVAARGSDFWIAWQQWFLGDALCNLALTPAVFCFVRDFRTLGRATPRRRVETLLLTASVFISSYSAFHLVRSDSLYPPFLLYLPLPFVLWAAIRFGPLAASGALSVVTVLSVGGTLAGRGPFSQYQAASAILEIQLFLFTLGIPFLFLAVLIRDRQNAQEKLSQLTRRLTDVQEAERYRIGQELHDDLGQRLTVLTWGLKGLAQRVGRGDRLTPEFDRLRAQATDIFHDIVRLSHELRPVILEKLGLTSALQSLCEQATTDGVVVRFVRDGEPRRAADHVELSLYRVAQEALRNALNHSRSDRIVIRLSESDDGGLELTVTDDGCGFVVGPAKAPTGLGLAGMAERMKNAGGVLRIASTPGIGTTVTAWVAWVGTEDRSGTQQISAG